MRLISQDGMIDVPYDKVVVKVTEHPFKTIISALFEREDYMKDIVMGCYSTESKALKVMEMLREKYAKLEIFKSIYQKGLLTELNKELGFDEMQNTLTSIFKFPDDSEVEV